MSVRRKRAVRALRKLLELRQRALAADALAADAKQDAERAHKRLKLEKQYRHDAENDLAAAVAANRAIRHGLAVALRGVAIALEQ